MAILDLRSHAGTPGITSRVTAWLGRAAQAQAQRSLYRRTVRELGSLGDRDLADIGINRSMIASVAAESVKAPARR